MEKLWDQYERVCKDSSTIVLFGSGVFTAKLILSKENWYKYSLVWKKSKCGSPLLAKYRPMMKHEDVVIFTKGGGKHKTFNPTLISGKPYHRSNVAIKTNYHNYGIKQVTTSNNGTRYMDSVLNFPQKWRRQDQTHPTQKPVELIEHLIKTYSNENDMFLDNCAGTGSSLVAAKRTNRQFIGIEKDEKYYQVCAESLKIIQ
jgi:site-specific DNA-methyltransferase (adenine-specific)